jgi:chromosome segregation ATPase
MKRHFARALLVLAVVPCGSGCSMVPRTELADCAQRCRVLQAESGQLKDELLSLRSQNRDLSQRAVDDSKRLQTLEEANRRLEEHITGYQQDRDTIAAAYEKLQAQLRTAGDSPPATASRSGP